VHEGIDVEPRRLAAIGEVGSWIVLVVDRDQVGPDPKRMLDSADREWKRAAAMRESKTQFRITIENPAKHQATNREGRFGGHADQPGQPIFRHPPFADHVPGMNEDGRAQFFRRLPEHVEGRMVEVPAIRAVAMLVRVDVRADLDTA
jgi:hypothetical protein